MPAGKRKLSSLAQYFVDETVLSATSKSGFVVESTCVCCDETWPAMSGSRKVAHLCHIPGQGVGKCSYDKRSLSGSEIQELAGLTKSGKAWLSRGGGGPSPHLPSVPSNSGSQHGHGLSSLFV